MHIYQSPGQAVTVTLVEDFPLHFQLSAFRPGSLISVVTQFLICVYPGNYSYLQLSTSVSLPSGG